MGDLRGIRPIPTGSKSPKFYFLAVYFKLSSFVRLCQVIVGGSDVTVNNGKNNFKLRVLQLYSTHPQKTCQLECILQD